MGRVGYGWLAAVVLAAVVPVPGVAYAAGAVDAGAVERLVTGFAGRAGYPGIAVAITKGGQVLHTAGYGRDSTGAAVTATTPMPVASLSKSVTALAVMRLVEDGRVELDAPVRRYLTDFRVADPRGERITVRQLLDHTSGITDGTLAEKSLRQPDSLADAVVRARSATLATAPGTAHAYTNTNYHLAARLVEVVAGEPWAEHLRRRVFEPLGMRATTTIDRTPRDLPPGVARGHVYAYGASVPAAEPDRFVAGSDGVITTARDLAQWLILQNDRTGSVAATHASPDPRWTYGLGWDTESDGRVRHNGVWFTCTASALLLPSGHGIAVLGNSGIGLANEGTDQLADALAALVTGGRAPSGAPARWIADLVLAGLTLVSVVLGVRNLRRARTWAKRGPSWRLALRLIPLVLLIALPDLLGRVLAGGRDITFGQLAYYSPALVVWASCAALLNLGVLTARVAALLRPAPETTQGPVRAVPD
jgi:CubicO group peptidase (beta-lactamase class C family)